MKPKFVCLAAILSGLIVVAAGFPVEGDPDALDNYDILPDVNATSSPRDIATSTSAAIVATTTSTLAKTAAASNGSEDSLDKVLKILQILLGAVAFLFIVGVSVWAAKRGEVVDWQNGWAGTVVRVILRARDGVAAYQEAREARREIRDLVR